MFFKQYIEQNKKKYDFVYAQFYFSGLFDKIEEHWSSVFCGDVCLEDNRLAIKMNNIPDDEAKAFKEFLENLMKEMFEPKYIPEIEIQRNDVSWDHSVYFICY